ncbi:B12-binding domain-containing radical SAM protein [bacterium]|nr:B12-binding domain-containing radical SAM protein [bacterium]
MFFREYIRELQRVERGSVRQNKSASVKIALVYPNRYCVGMASLGFQTVYRIFNNHPGVRCERAFLYEAPYDREVRTLESGERLSCFDLVGFSLSFELDLFNVIRILMRTGIRILAEDRIEKDPLVFIGGIVTSLNPAPLLPFVDGLVVGEGEKCIHQIADALYAAKQKKVSRPEKLQTLNEIEGIFIPAINTPVKKQILHSLEAYPTYTPIVTPKSHFKNMFIVEVGRGCTRGCLFCAAKKAYYPYRLRSIESIIETVARWNPGAHRIGLGGAALSDYPDLEDLCEAFVNMGHEISLSSIRADRVTPNLVNLLDRGKVKSFTIAPEAGTERLRQSIGKGIADETLKQVVLLLKNSTINIMKLYFLIGLPGETGEDIQAMVRLIQELASIFHSKNKRKLIRLSVNAFIPKPFTEFQWLPMAGERILAEKLCMIKQGLKGKKNIVLISKNLRNDIMEGILSLGDEKVGLTVGETVVKGIPWKKAVKNQGIDVDTLLHHEKSLEAKLPWDFIQNTVSKQKLWDAYQGGTR